jgi:hypothetical protein
MRAVKTGNVPDELHTPPAFRASISATACRPKYPVQTKECLATYIPIGGMNTFTLIDLGSDCDAVSPNFARIAKLDIVELDKPIPLELGCKGSKSKITHGVYAQTGMGARPKLTRRYFDVANIVHYDALVGMPFCADHGLIIDVKNRSISLPNGEVIQAAPEGARTGAYNKWAKKEPTAPKGARSSFRT